MPQQRVEWYLAVVFVAGLGLHEILHAIFADFTGNAEFVGSILSMDATSLPDSWRSIDHPAAGYVAYGFIWATHIAAGVLSIVGCVMMAVSVQQNRRRLLRGFSFAFLGVGVAAALYLIGFTTIANAWFQLWEASRPPNFLAEAERLFLLNMAVLVYLLLVRQYAEYRR